MSEALHDEILALESIYDNVQTMCDANKTRIELPIEIEVDASCRVYGSPFHLRHLPPVLLQVIVDTKSYPYESRPISVALQSKWTVKSLTWLRRLEMQLLDLWCSDVVVFSMIDHLHAALSGLGEPLQIIPTIQHSSFEQYLIAYNSDQSTEAFQSQTFPCSICLEPQKGRRCIQLACSHVFCMACLHAYFSLSIHEGLAKNVKCPDSECASSSTPLPEISQDILSIIVGKEMLDRYNWLVEKQAWEEDPTISYCPRDSCQAPVPKDPSEAYAKLRQCPRCHFSFCAFCRRTWHGNAEACKVDNAESLAVKYLEADSDGQALLDKQYGANNMKKLIATYLEDKANSEWKSQNTTTCPNCSVAVEKSQGCSHMTCSKCHCHFCFRCGTKLKADEPYKHFSDKGGGCYNKLFDYEPEQEENANWNAIIGLL